MQDFLNFNTFIAPDVLIFFYYIGALFIPFLLYKFRLYLLKKFSFESKVEQKFQTLFHSLSKRDRVNVIVSMIVLFFCMELCWRIIFEAMIGYFDMHNYLYEIDMKLQGR